MRCRAAPSSKPASASKNVPLHTEAVRRAWPEALRNQSTSAVFSSMACSMAGAPGTTRVSMAAGSNCAKATVSTLKPSAVGISPPARLALCNT